MHRIVVLALDGVYPFDLGIPARVFGETEGRYEVLTCSVDGRPVVTSADFEISVRHDRDVIRTADTIVVPAFDPHRATRTLEPAVAEAISLVAPGTRVMSICTGAFVLAAAGLLDGRPATTHWLLADHFTHWFPQVSLDPSVLFVDDGDVLTSAGTTAGIDLCLHVLRSDHGSSLANQVARKCVTPAWRDGGQAQYIERPVPPKPDLSTSPTRQWALDNLDLPLTLADLAEHAQMSRRTFTRRFHEETGDSPGRWLTNQRVLRARELLEETDLSVDRVAARAGFTTATSLRQHLHAAVGVAPLTYRRTFRATEA